MARIASIKIMAVYLMVGLLCTLMFWFVANIKTADLKIPLDYNGDALYYGALVKTYLDNGSFLDNKFLGAPETLNWRDYPETLDNLNLLLIRIIALFSKQWPVVLNLFYILTYPLVGVSALYALRQMKLRTPIAFVGSLLFALLPYHFERGEVHLFLSAYYAVPLAILICYRIYQEGNWRKWSSFVSCLVLGSTGPYYAFFGGFFIFITGIYTSLEKRRWRDLLIACLFSLSILAIAVIHLTPNIFHSIQYGWNNSFFRRNIGETEIYGLKIAQLLLPIAGRLRLIYDREAFLINENSDSSLGLIGSIGFLLLVAVRIFNFRGGDVRLTRQLKLWGSLIIGGSFLGVVGGGGSLLSLFGFSQIRSYNRISVYLAFMSILAVCLVVNSWFQEKSRRWIQGAYFLVVIAVLVVGLLSQTTRKKRYMVAIQRFKKDAAFFTEVSSMVKDGTLIFQLPYNTFPESPPVWNLEPYENIKPYLHTNGLRWSYGTMTDRYIDLWQKEMANTPTERIVESVKMAGFGGILISKAGYADNGVALEEELVRILGTKPLSDEQTRFSFFRFEVAKKDQKPNYPVLTRWIEGCYPIEIATGRSWQWCRDQAALIVINPDSKNHPVKLEMSLASGSNEPSDLIVSGLLKKTLTVDSIERRFSEKIVVPPGRHLVSFFSEANPLNLKNDRRWMVFRVVNYKAIDLGIRFSSFSSSLRSSVSTIEE